MITISPILFSFERWLVLAVILSIVSERFQPILLHFISNWDKRWSTYQIHILTACNCPSVAFFSFIHFSIYFQLVRKPSLSEMKILLFTKSVALFCLLLTEVRSWENFKIVRETSPRDTFTIPPSKCDKNNDTFDYCSEYNAAAVKGQRCQCGCHDKYATFSFYKQSWSCLKNEDARTFFGKLSYHSYCCFSLSHLKTVTVLITNKQACFNFTCSFSLIRTQWITFRGKRWRFKVHFNLCLS